MAATSESPESPRRQCAIAERPAESFAIRSGPRFRSTLSELRDELAAASMTGVSPPFAISSSTEALALSRRY
eukprot:scaffold581307_cov42-Prasinocladus_malaysianus.AAC.1